MNIPFFNREVPSLHAAALILGAAGLLSKLLGLVRDRMLAARFGAGPDLDVYYAAFQLPDIVYTILLAGAASAAVLPVLVAYERHGRDDVERFVSNLLIVFTLIGTAIASLAWLAAPVLISILAPGFDPEHAALALRLTRIMLANTVLIGIAGILSALLQARHRFFVFALPPIVYNLGIIAGILLVVPYLGVTGLAYGVVAGGVLQVLIQLPAIRGLGFRFRPRRALADAGLRAVLRTSLPRVAALGMSQLTLAALIAIASYFASGSISVFRFGANLLYVPVGLFGVSWALALFPKLSSASVGGEGEAFRRQVALGIRSILFWARPAATLAIVLRAHIVRVVLGSGVFNWEDTRLVAAVLAVLALAVISESLLPLVLRAFYALGRTAEPLLWDILGSVLTVAAAIGLAAFFAARPDALLAIARVLRIGDLAPPHILAVAIAFAAGSLLNLSLLLGSLRRASRKHMRVLLSFEFNAVLTMAGAAVLAGVAAYLALLPFPAVVATNTFLGIFAQGAVAAVAGLAVYAGVLATQGNPEMLAMMASFRQRLINPMKTPRVFDTEKIDREGVT
ncbi:MAG: murein biosynthesis integral membrane protein MurJ [bacterium]|nr:murein biosynthesis integral membrane protein MurJ [bacterium]